MPFEIRMKGRFSGLFCDFRVISTSEGYLLNNDLKRSLGYGKMVDGKTAPKDCKKGSKKGTNMTQTEKRKAKMPKGQMLPFSRGHLHMASQFR